MKLLNAVNLTKQESIVFFCFKESVLWISGKRKTEAHLRRVASAFFLALDIVFPETVLKAPFMSVGIFGMQQALVALIMPVRSDRYDVFTYLIIQALHEF